VRAAQPRPRRLSSRRVAGETLIFSRKLHRFRHSIALVQAFTVINKLNGPHTRFLWYRVPVAEKGFCPEAASTLESSI
jgi:hypothetical protein